jgi:ABC-type uncharacterized transport system permease subunit
MILSPSPWWYTILALGAALGYVLLALKPIEFGNRHLKTGVWLLHGITLVTGLWGEATHFGFAPALSATAWLVFALYVVESRLYPQLRVNPVLVGLGAGTLVLAWVFPGTRYLHANSPWLPVHWSLGLISYGLLAAAVWHGWLMQRTEASIRQARADGVGLPLLALERLTFKLVTAAFVLLSATLLAGWWLSSQGWTHAWSWNHKTLFTVSSWLVLAVLLGGRHLRGWRGRLAIHMLYAAATLLLLGYVGSRFVLEVILVRP